MIATVVAAAVAVAGLVGPVADDIARRESVRRAEVTSGPGAADRIPPQQLPVTPAKE